MVAQFAKAVRPINLAIVGGYQYIIYYKYILSIIDDSRLSTLNFFGFVVTTLLITAGGYLINDYYDYDGDQINKANWHTLSSAQLKNSYIFLSLIGLVISLTIAYQIGHIVYAGLYLVAVGLLFLYSAWAKRQALIGNIIVALFSGLSILVLLMTEYPALLLAKSIYPQGHHRALVIIVGMSIMAFFVSLLREIVKDVEDITGDKASGYHTLPIAIGIPRTQYLIIFYTLLALVLSGMWVALQWEMISLIASLYYVIGVMGSLLVCCYLAFRLDGKSDYTRLSTMLKITMVIAMIYTCIA